MTKPTGRPVGRPSKYKPEYCEQALELGETGHSIAEIAAKFEVDKASVYRWMEEHPDFALSMARAKTLEQAYFEKEARLNMKNKDFNANLWWRSALSRFRDDYAEKKITEVSGPNGAPVQIESKTIDTGSLSPEELVAFRNLVVKLKGSS